jgi:aromatic-L-amino-acid/L-tryptophan decarboxylase
VSLVQSSQDFSLVTEPSFALSVFRLTPSLPSAFTDAQALEALNELNRAYFGRLSSRSEILLTQTKLNGVFCMRFAIGAARTTKGHIDKAWAILQEEAETALKGWRDKRAVASQ